MQLPPDKKVYFLSDFHLGVPTPGKSREREKLIVQFLDEAAKDAHTIFLVGDMFDFWFEYSTVVPRGYVRLLGKLAELSDAGIQLHFFVGNHDMWVNNYLQQELNMPVYFGPQTFTFNDCRFYIAHGDGLGPGDHGYKALKKLFRSPVSQWLFGVLPPAIGVGTANYFSRKSRKAQEHVEESFRGEENEWLLIYSRGILQKEHYDFLIFGHRHLPIDYRLGAGSRYINLGEWMNFQTYAVFDGSSLELRSYTGKNDKIYRKP
ncbi:UDP-2,3-diacylglucosamine diphosphatase [Flavisolibacter nicotianae]|uniref:UDP-2,3-diacylglucosamine diphosphatase n=1 Tax=Flavisolibacter nicotianae TaxID=2364882 RepID=UPI000EAD6758|nr:UDP-2,3-diacylglucosamine diphosphatase [Flavisolibacter nicotianae]